MKKFKSGDLVENIHTSEIEMIDRIEYSRLGNQILYMVDSIQIKGIGIMSYHYRPISPKKIKFKLKIK